MKVGALAILMVVSNVVCMAGVIGWGYFVFFAKQNVPAICIWMAIGGLIAAIVSFISLLVTAE